MEILPIKWSGDRLVLLDQTRLPAEIVYEEYKTAEAVYDAIKAMKVRGAPAIGVAAAYGLYLGVVESTADMTEQITDQITTETTDENLEAFYTILEQKAALLATSRPTAVNLFWALDRMKKTARETGRKIVNVSVNKNPSDNKNPGDNKNLNVTVNESVSVKVSESISVSVSTNVKKLLEVLLTEAIAIHAEDEEINRKIGQNLLTLLKDGQGILTHCNAGALATTRYGTALAPIYLAQEKGWNFRVYADETRPRLQGSMLTAFELSQAGIPVTVITDSMAAVIMSKGLVGAVITGCDRIAANGDTANKIGTYGLSILARYFDIPFYIAAPTPTIDLNTPDGSAIPIEERDPDEVACRFGVRTVPALPCISVYNPSFDVTPAENITAIITEKGIIFRPDKNKIFQMMTT
ncbi:MAG: S-methyl-5-thioribose-1-phosphate isomerase [Clostridiales bacterium]|nr:S-methyl-5-thioribose-1-phosphate isomerase [Clostridiales bacterium]